MRKFFCEHYIDREYKTILSLKLDSTIDENNLTFDLENAPQGVNFNSDTKELSWIPKAIDKGEAEFYINVSDGLVNYRKIFKISVLELEQVNSIFASSSGGVYVIQAPDSVLNKAKITLPSNEKSYSINIYQAINNGSIVFKTESSSFLKSPMIIDFEDEVEVTQRFEGLDHVANESTSYNYSYFSKKAKRFVACNGDELLIRHEESLDSFQNQTRFKWESIKQSLGVDNYSANLGSNTVSILQSLNTPSKKANLINILDHLSSLKSLITDAEIYIVDSSVPELGDSPGMHGEGDKRTFFLNLSSLNGISKNPTTKLVFSEPLKKHVILHEYYHVQQARAMGCTPNFSKRSAGYRNFTEGSADYIPLSQLSKAERDSIAKDKYKNEGFLTSPYTIGNTVLGNGLLKPNADYTTRIMWDYLNFDPLLFFQNLGNYLRVNFENPGPISGDAITTKILKTTNGGDLLQSLINFTDGIYNYNSVPISYRQTIPLISIIKDNSIFTGWGSIQDIENNKIKLNEMSPNFAGIEIELTLPGLSGISKNFLTRELISRLQDPLFNNVLSVEIPNDPEISLNVRSEEVDAQGNVIPYNSTESYKWLVFGKKANSYSSDFQSLFNINQRVTVNIVNQSSENKKIKLLVHFLNPIIELNISDVGQSGLSRDPFEPYKFIYPNETTSSKNLMVEAFDRSDVDNSTTFRFIYNTFCSFCEYKFRSSPKDIENVNSISDFSIPYSTWNNNSGYSLQVIATNKAGESTTRIFYVLVPKDKKPTATLYLQECYPNCGYGCEGNDTILYTALLKVTDPDSDMGDPELPWTHIYSNQGRLSTPPFSVPWGGGSVTVNIPACTK
ncbi:MAG: hypothetical protein WC635_03955 [Bacteriovorax sp.]|jgi:hypothetical protein